MNSDLFIKIAGVLIAAILAYFQIQNYRKMERKTLHLDLELLEKIDPSNKNYKIIKEKIDRAIEKTYGKPYLDSSFKFKFKLFLIGSIFIASILGYLSYYFFKTGSPFFSFMFGYFSLSSLLVIPVKIHKINVIYSVVLNITTSILHSIAFMIESNRVNDLFKVIKVFMEESKNNEDNFEALWNLQHSLDHIKKSVQDVELARKKS